MKKTSVASAVAVALGISINAEAGTAGLTGVWTGSYSMIFLGVGGGPIGSSSPPQSWTWNFDAGAVDIENTATFYVSVWTAHDVTFSDTGSSYGPAGGYGSVNMLWDWSTYTNIPITSDWDVTATGNSPGSTAVVSVNWVDITPESPAFPGFSPNFTGSLQKVPVPPAVWLLGSGLIGLIGFARRKK